MLPRIDIRGRSFGEPLHTAVDKRQYSVLLLPCMGRPAAGAGGAVMFRSLPELKRAICLTIAATSFGFLGHSDPAAADFLTEPGGSNLVFISQHEYTPLPLGSVEAGNWPYPVWAARSFIAFYHVLPWPLAHQVG